MKFYYCEFPNQAIVITGLGLILQEQRKYLESRTSQFNLRESTDTQVKMPPASPSPGPEDTVCLLLTPVSSSPSWGSLVTLGCLEWSHLELEKYKLKTQN